MSGAYVYVRRSLGAVEIRVWNKTSWFLKGHTPDGFTSLCTVRPLDCRYRFFRFTTRPGTSELEYHVHTARASDPPPTVSVKLFAYFIAMDGATCILFMPILSH